MSITQSQTPEQFSHGVEELGDWVTDRDPTDHLTLNDAHWLAKLMMVVGPSLTAVYAQHVDRIDEHTPRGKSTLCSMCGETAPCGPLLLLHEADPDGVDNYLACNGVVVEWEA